MKLYFKNNQGKERLISEVEDIEEAHAKIKDFCCERDFKIRYTRCWGSLSENGICVDVGSWSENFIIRE